MKPRTVRITVLEFRGYEGWQADTLLQGNDAKCGFACRTTAAKTGYVFTEYAAR